MVRKHCEKRRKCWLPAFSLSPTMFSQGFFFKVIKSRDLVVKRSRRFQHYFSYTSGASSPMHAFLKFSGPVFKPIFFLSDWLLSLLTIVETMGSGERGMTIISPLKGALSESEIEPATFCSLVMYITD